LDRALYIRWVRAVNDKRTFISYIPPEYSFQRDIIEKSKGIFFCLQLNEPFENSLNSVPEGDLILLYQTLRDTTNNIMVKCLTHLVTPIGDRVIPNPYQYDGWNGRWVKVIAMTKNTV
jgi:hypothetical protein